MLTPYKILRITFGENEERRRGGGIMNRKWTRYNKKYPDCQKPNYKIPKRTHTNCCRLSDSLIMFQKTYFVLKAEN